MMEFMYMQARIKEFVQGQLGCQCPDEIFETIDCVDNFTVSDGTVIKSRINVGNMLLVYVVEANEKVTSDYLMNLLQHGRSERDNRGFNRFRLAICTDHEVEVLMQLKEVDIAADGKGASLEHAIGLDERVHAHIVPWGSF